MSAKRLGGLGSKMAIFADNQYFTHADIVQWVGLGGGSEKVQKYDDVV